MIESFDKYFQVVILMSQFDIIADTGKQIEIQLVNMWNVIHRKHEVCKSKIVI